MNLRITELLLAAVKVSGVFSITAASRAASEGAGDSTQLGVAAEGGGASAAQLDAVLAEAASRGVHSEEAGRLLSSVRLVRRLRVVRPGLDGLRLRRGIRIRLGMLRLRSWPTGRCHP